MSHKFCRPRQFRMVSVTHYTTMARNIYKNIFFHLLTFPYTHEPYSRDISILFILFFFFSFLFFRRYGQTWKEQIWFESENYGTLWSNGLADFWLIFGIYLKRLEFVIRQNMCVCVCVYAYAIKLPGKYFDLPCVCFYERTFFFIDITSEVLLVAGVNFI